MPLPIESCFQLFYHWLTLWAPSSTLLALTLLGHSQILLELFVYFGKQQQSICIQKHKNCAPKIPWYDG
jgi:hypothetical protein